MNESVISLKSGTVALPSAPRAPRLCPALRARLRAAGALADRHIAWALPLLLLLAWELSTRLGLIRPLFLPAPLAVAQTFHDLLVNDRLWLDFTVSVVGVLRGFVVGTAGGLLLGFMAGASRTVDRFLGATLDSIRQVPPLAWLPLLVLWIGAGSLAKTVIIAKTVFFPVFMNTLQGIRGVAREYIEVGRVFGLGRAQLLRRIVIPAALPGIFTGLRFGVGLAWATIILAEMLGGRQGLGYLLTRAQELLLTSQLFVVIVIIGAVGLLIDKGLRRVEARLLHWKKGFEG
ncbi:MAG: ABC transporter permease [Verrucomicrobiales bacterium]|jgi:sulfonate transport system permease protein|nr:ABC transporter permease [Verrucomicrobiales bacterium]